jgi:hypothetical protein
MALGEIVLFLIALFLAVVLWPILWRLGAILLLIVIGLILVVAGSA